MKHSSARSQCFQMPRPNSSSSNPAQSNPSVLGVTPIVSDPRRPNQPVSSTNIAWNRALADSALNLTKS